MTVTGVYLALRCAGLVAEWMKGDRDRRAWGLSVVVQAGFVLWAVATGSLALVPLMALGIAVSMRNLWEWSKPQGRPYVVTLENELAETVEQYAELLRRFEARVEQDGQVRHDRARYTRRLNTYAHDLRALALAAGADAPPVPEPPKEGA